MVTGIKIKKHNSNCRTTGNPRARVIVFYKKVHKKHKSNILFHFFPSVDSAAICRVQSYRDRIVRTVHRVPDSRLPDKSHSSYPPRHIRPLTCTFHNGSIYIVVRGLSPLHSPMHHEWSVLIFEPPPTLPPPPPLPTPTELFTLIFHHCALHCPSFLYASRSTQSNYPAK